MPPKKKIEGKLNFEPAPPRARRGAQVIDDESEIDLDDEDLAGVNLGDDD